MDIKFISFYTQNYKNEAKELVESFNKMGMTNYEVELRDSIGDWTANTQIKAPFILEKLKQNDAVVWTDADSRIKQIPSFFDTVKTDVAMFYMPRHYTNNFKLPPNSILIEEQVDSEGYLQSGTMFFKNNKRTIALLESWIELNEKDRSQWDQWTLQVCVSKSKVTKTTLPSEYNYIDIVGPLISDNPPVILHTQASRRFRKKRR